MQSTGHTSTQAVSFVSIQGSVMINGISPFPPPGVRSYRKAAGFARTVWVVFRGRPPDADYTCRSWPKRRLPLHLQPDTPHDAGPSRPTSLKTVSYTHLTLPTIYSV